MDLVWTTLNSNPVNIQSWKQGSKYQNQMVPDRAIPGPVPVKIRNLGPEKLRNPGPTRKGFQDFVSGWPKIEKILQFF